MCDEVCSRGTCCLRCGLFGSILLMITGVGLTIAGVVVFGATNPRVALVDEYNKLGNAYQNKDFGPFASMTFSVNASGTVKSAAQAVSLVDVIGSIDGVADFSSRIFVVTGIPRGELSRATVIARGSTSAFSPLIFSAAPLSTVHTSKLYCESKECNGKDKCTCSTAMMQEKCTSLYNGSYTSTGYGKDCRTDRSEDDACGQCRYTVYLTGVCVPMTFDPSAITVVPSLKYSSCEYPFGSADGQYASTNPDTPVSVKFMADTDPLIQLQRLTKGSRNLGWSSKDQNTVGAGLLVPGILAILAAVGCIVWIRRSHEEDMQEARARAENGGFEMQARGAVGDNNNNGESHHPTAHAIQVGQPIHQAPPPGVIDYSHPTTPAMGPGPQQQQQQQQPGGYYGQPQYGYAAAAPPVKTAA